MRRSDFTFDVFGKIVSTVDPWNADETNAELLERMKCALRVAVENDLSDRQREVVTMFFFENMKNKEIAKALGISKSTVSRHLSRAIEILKKSLKHGMFKIWD